MSLEDLLRNLGSHDFVGVVAPNFLRPALSASLACIRAFALGQSPLPPRIADATAEVLCVLIHTIAKIGVRHTTLAALAAKPLDKVHQPKL
jgi:hypothetical protein